MSVILEFTIESREFPFGRLLTELPDIRVEMEKIVPTGSSVIPFVWVSGDDFSEFEQRIKETDRITDLVALDRLEGTALYKVVWEETPHDLLLGLAETQGVILEGYGDDTWTFRVRFPNHDALSRFYNFCTDHEIKIHIDRSFTLTERTEFKHQFKLSQEQRDAILLGLNKGYFDTPAQAGLEEIAAELGISSQACSHRIRRGVKQILRETMLHSGEHSP
jgi:predicted DNA binding protein